MEVTVNVEMNSQELVIFRRALAQAADDKLLPIGAATRKIQQLDQLRWDAEEAAMRKTIQMSTMPTILASVKERKMLRA